MTPGSGVTASLLSRGSRGGGSPSMITGIPISETVASTPATRSRAATAASSEPSAEVKRAEEQFKRGLMIRGEAAYPDESGKLPLDATHEIVEPAEEGGTSLPAVKRVRFKIF